MKSETDLLQNGLQRFLSINPFIVIVTVLFCLSLCAAFPTLDRTYDIPQIVAFWLLGITLWFYLAKKNFDNLQWLICLPIILPSIFLGTIYIPHETFVAISLVAVLTFLISTMQPKQRETLHLSVIAIASLQTCLIFASYISNDHSFIGLRQLNGIPVGTIGNPDFLATVIGAGIFFCFSRELPRPLKIFILALLSVGLLLTRSRGTIALVCTLIAWDLIPKRIVGYALATLTVIVISFWDRFAGRIQLWWTSGVAFFEAPLNGHGVGNFDSVYFNTNLNLMNSSESFRHTFGPWSSQVTDAHNIILHWAVEFGLWGVIASALALGSLIIAAKRLSADNRRVVVTMVIKSLYTVVLISLQSLSLLALSLGSKARENSDKDRSWSLYLSLFLLVSTAPPIIQSTLNSRDLYQSLRYVTNGLVQKSLLHANRVLERDPKNTDALLAKSYSYLKLGQCSLSSSYALSAARFRQNMDVYKRASHILFDCEFYQESLGLLQELHTVFPEHRTTAMKMAWSHYYLGDYSEAKKLAQHTLSLKPRRISLSDKRNLSEAKDLLRILHQN